MWKQEAEDAELNHGKTTLATWMLVLLQWRCGLEDLFRSLRSDCYGHLLPGPSHSQYHRAETLTLSCDMGLLRFCVTFAREPFVHSLRLRVLRSQL